MGLWRWLSSLARNIRADEERLHSLALDEVERGVRRNGLWAKALAQAQGDERKARGRYIKLLVAKLRDEEKDLEDLERIFTKAQNELADNVVKNSPENISANDQDVQTNAPEAPPLKAAWWKRRKEQSDWHIQQIIAENRYKRERYRRTKTPSQITTGKLPRKPPRKAPRKPPQKPPSKPRKPTVYERLSNVMLILFALAAGLLLLLNLLGH